MAMTAGDGIYSTLAKLTPGASDAPNYDEVYAEIFSLHQAKCADFELCKVVAHGSQGTVFCVRCRMESLPPCCENKLYALKVFYHFRVSASDDHFDSFRRARENEWQVLSKALRHRNIIRIWTCFEDTIGDAFWEKLPEKAREAILHSSGGENGRRVAQFVVFDHYEQCIRETLQTLPQPLPYAQAKQWALQLLDVAMYLRSKHIVHCDMKLEHLLLTPNQELVLTGFSCAKHLKEHFFFPYSRNASPGGSEANVAPEVLNEFAKLRRGSQEDHHAVDYGHQTAWAVGVIIYEAITGRRPLANYPTAFLQEDGRVSYTLDEIEHLPTSCGDELDEILRGLLEPDPVKRLDEEEAMQRVWAIPDGSIHAQLGEAERELSKEREKRQKAEQERDSANELKNNLVQERVRLVKEKKELRGRCTELERRCEELSIARDPHGERHSEEAWQTRQPSYSDALRDLDMAVRERDAFMVQARRLREEAGECTQKLTNLAQQRDAARADVQRLTRDAEELRQDLASLSSRENRFVLETKQVKEGHLITMRELEAVRRQMEDLERTNSELRRRLAEREKEVLEQRALLDARTSSSERMPYYTSHQRDVSEAASASPQLPLLHSHTSSPAMMTSSYTSAAAGDGRLQTPTSPGAIAPAELPRNPTGFIQQVGDVIRNTFSGISKPDGTPQPVSQPTALPNLTRETAGRSTPPTEAELFLACGLDKCKTPGCTFYGHPSTDDYCSKCSAEHRRKNFTAPAAILPRNESLDQSSTQQQSQGNFTGPIRFPVSYEELPRQLEATTQAVTATSPHPFTRLCSERGCEYCGSDEYGGRCFRCFMEMTKKEAGPTFEPAFGDPYVASTLPAIAARNEHTLQHSQSYSTTVPSQAQACRNPVCPHYGRPDMNGLCSGCFRSGYQAR